MLKPYRVHKERKAVIAKSGGYYIVGKSIWDPIGGWRFVGSHRFVFLKNAEIYAKLFEASTMN